MNPLLNDYYASQREAMALYDATTKAAQGNAAMGGNPLAPRMTATPGGTMSLAPIMGAGGATLPMAGESANIFGGGGFVPFGGFRARGGPVMPGRAYIVGERGPEMIVPEMPGQVVPNGGSRAAQSPMNRPYAELAGGTGSLAKRPATPTGRSASDPARAAESAARFLRSRGDPVGAARLLQNGALLNARVNGLPDMPLPVPQPPALMAPPPGGKLVPGRSAGSMVWQQDTPAAAASGPVPLPPISIPKATGAMPTAEEPVNPFQLDPLGNYVNPQANLSPHGFGAMNERLAADPAGFPGLPMPPPGLYGAEAPPRLTMEQAPGSEYGMPFFDGQPSKQLIPLAKPPPAPKAEPAKLPDGLQWEKDREGRIIGAVFPQHDAASGKWNLQRMDLNRDGVVSPGEAAKAQAAGAGGAPAAPAGGVSPALANPALDALRRLRSPTR